MDVGGVPQCLWAVMPYAVMRSGWEGSDGIRINY